MLLLMFNTEKHLLIQSNPYFVGGKPDISKSFAFCQCQVQKVYKSAIKIPRNINVFTITFDPLLLLGVVVVLGLAVVVFGLTVVVVFGLTLV